MRRSTGILTVAFLVLAAGAPALVAAPVKPAKSLLENARLFQIDGSHSSIEFAVPWMGLTKVKGSFSEVRGTLAFDGADLTRSSLTILIRMPSITTFNAMRDKDLKGPNFFDVEKYPTSLFTSRSIEKSGDGYLMRGDLTIKGVTKQVEVPFHYLGEVVDSGGIGHRLGFEGQFAIDRRDYGVAGSDQFNKLTQLGARMIGDKIDLLLQIQGWMFTPDKLAGPRDSFYQVIVARGSKEAAKGYRERRKTTPDSLMAVDEEVLNFVGYHLLRNGRPQDALALFELEAEYFPESAFAQVGLGQSYAVLGDRERSIESCEKAVKMDSGATRALEILHRLKGQPG